MRTVSPEPLRRSFTCPHCDTTAVHKWANFDSVLEIKDNPDDSGYVGELGASWSDMNHRSSCPRIFVQYDGLRDWGVSECTNCHGLTIWHNDSLVYPEACPVEEANEDMPQEVGSIYGEASQVFTRSPRASAALLRLALQMLLQEILGSESSGRIFNDIGLLGDRGVRPQIIKVMDVLRYNGNESVHPGEINLADNRDDALLLFTILNMIAEEFFTMDARLDELYQRIPERKRVEVDQKRLG